MTNRGTYLHNELSSPSSILLLLLFPPAFSPPPLIKRDTVGYSEGTVGYNGGTVRVQWGYSGGTVGVQCTPISAPLSLFTLHHF